MEEKKDANAVVEKEDLSEPMVYTYAGNALGKKLKKWALKNIHRGLKKYVK